MTAMPNSGLYRITVPQYHRMIESAVLTEDDRVELLDGYLVEKMPHDPIHDGTVQRINRRLARVLPRGWEVRVQSSATLLESEPEPDLALVREDPGEFMSRHPGPSDFGIIIEVANSSLNLDRKEKTAIYAEAGIPIYWIANVADHQIEVHEQPSGPGPNPRYGSRTIYRPGDAVPVMLDGHTIGSIPVNDLLP